MKTRKKNILLAIIMVMTMTVLNVSIFAYAESVSFDTVTISNNGLITPYSNSTFNVNFYVNASSSTSTGYLSLSLYNGSYSGNYYPVQTISANVTNVSTNPNRYNVSGNFSSNIPAGTYTIVINNDSAWYFSNPYVGSAYTSGYYPYNYNYNYNYNYYDPYYYNNRVTISGRAYTYSNGSKTPLSGVRVYAYRNDSNSSSDYIGESYTDSNGNYTIDSTNSNNYYGGSVRIYADYSGQRRLNSAESDFDSDYRVISLSGSSGSYYNDPYYYYGYYNNGYYNNYYNYNYNYYNYSYYDPSTGLYYYYDPNTNTYFSSPSSTNPYYNNGYYNGYNNGYYNYYNNGYYYGTLTASQDFVFVPQLTIKGRVLDPNNGKALTGISVYTSGTTDSSGNFNVTGVTDLGSANNLNVYRNNTTIGYINVNANMSDFKHGSIQRDFTLVPSSNYSSQAVTQDSTQSTTTTKSTASTTGYNDPRINKINLNGEAMYDVSNSNFSGNTTLDVYNDTTSFNMSFNVGLLVKASTINPSGNFIINTPSFKYYLPYSVVKKVSGLGNYLANSSIMNTDAFLNLSFNVKPVSSETASMIQETYPGVKVVSNSYDVKYSLSSYDGVKDMSSMLNSDTVLTDYVTMVINTTERGTAAIVRGSNGLYMVPAVFPDQTTARLFTRGNSEYIVVRNEKHNFTDISNHWAKDSIVDAGVRLIVFAPKAMKFEPNRAMSRAEFNAMLVRALGLKAQYGSSSGNFGDTWYNESVDTAISFGMLNFIDGTNYELDKSITRQEVAYMIDKALGLATANVNSMSSYKDEPNVSFTFKQPFANCMAQKLMVGGNEYLQPTETLSRAEAVVIMQRLYEYLARTY